MGDDHIDLDCIACAGAADITHATRDTVNPGCRTTFAQRRLVMPEGSHLRALHRLSGNHQASVDRDVALLWRCRIVDARLERIACAGRNEGQTAELWRHWRR